MGTCGNCRWWEENRAFDYAEYPGSCKRFAPSSFGRHLGSDFPRWVWPITGKDDWCGEWNARSAEEGK